MLFSAPAKGPVIISITPNSTTLKVTWNELSVDDSNGRITKYEVCYQLGSSVLNCNGEKEVLTGTNLKTMTKLTKLVPNKTYEVAVRAFTYIGPGPLGDSMSETTLKSGESI